MSINLLPQELKPKSYILTVSKTIKKIVIVGFLVFLVFTVVYVSLIYGISAKVKRANSSEVELENKIKALQETEQRLVLIQDRLTKIDNIGQYKNTRKQLGLVEELVKVLPEGATLTKISFDSGMINLNIDVVNSKKVSEVISLLDNKDKYEKFVLVSISSGKNNSGYGMDISVN